MVEMTPQTKFWHRLHAAGLVFVMLGLPGRWFEQDCHRTGLLAHAMEMAAAGDSRAGQTDSGLGDDGQSDCLCWLAWGPRSSGSIITQPVPQGALLAASFDSEQLPDRTTVRPPSRAPPVIRI